MHVDNIQDITVRILALCSEQPAIDALYLFGSAARGEGGPSSDLDLAVLLNETDASDFSLLSFVSLVERSCGCRADVVVLNRAGELLKYEVRRYGRLIFERDARRRKRFEILGRKSYEDFLYLHRRYVSAVLYGEKHG